MNEVRIYDRALSELELQNDSVSDHTSPEVALSGPATEEVEEGEHTYKLEVEAIDGNEKAPQSGIQRLWVEVIGRGTLIPLRTCLKGSCSDGFTVPIEFGYWGEHVVEVEVNAEDHGGNLTSERLILAPPSEQLSKCGQEHGKFNVASHGLPGGGTARTYNYGEGGELEFPVPPKEFEPLAANAEELEEYGFPARPSEPEALSAWEEDMAAYSSVPGEPEEMCRADGMTEILEPESSEAKGEAAEGAREWSTSNWAGFLATELGDPNYYVGIQGDYVSPIHTRICVQGVKRYRGLDLVDTGSPL